jgi:serine/threonine-protein kinase
MSSVYRAVDPNLRRTVAIKIIHPHLSDNEEFLRRFEEEAAAVAQLRHPSIIQVYDFNHDAGVYYMVMEYVSGETLQTRLKRLNDSGRRLPYLETVRYMTNICEAVDYAHKRSMIHRDIKPANIMLDLNGQAILMDFGIAKMVGAQKHTATGAVIGTAMYMSPEQIRSERFDHRTDIYSSGVVLFEMIDGSPPFASDSTMGLMMLHLNEPTPDLRQKQPDAPEDLVRLVEKAMAKEPAERFQSAAEMAAALRKVQANLQGLGQAGSTAAERVQIYASTAAQASAHVAAGKSPGATVLPTAEEKPAAAPRWFLAVGCAALLLALVCMLGGGAALADQFLPGGWLFPAGTVAAGALTTEDAATVPPGLAVTASETGASASPTRTSLALTPGTQSSPTPAAAGAVTETLTPIPPEGPYVLIINVVQDGPVYRVEYETIGFLESATGKHIHFFYNNIDPQSAGFPGPGPWFMHPGPRPFIAAIVAERPPDATKICALAAEPDHRIHPNSGNCFDLPADQPGATPGG